MPTSVINGLRLYYECHGDAGEPLVFVHGYTGDLSDWRPPLPTVDQMARDGEALVAAVGFQRYHLVGHSMGGAIVQEIALRSPQRLLSLTLEDTSLKFVAMGDDAMTDWHRERHALAVNEGMAAAAALPMPDTPPHMPAERLEETAERLSRMSLDPLVRAMM